ncbi:synaptic vesicle transporter SV2 [Fusarium tjaetaba]|uniref:Synaptic vesicle transporter SV2 n=1 Tax=Fusarium tjaetaba TaxID=1567544 RepID=A0A8H5SCE7_9HYPO|nr:synaptic vesicle transporter SV2 [Fusarium tjaetaba]KAF5649108.1 synaptic vesicle transporter SV2 [Fusarium tjaetaba]
MSSVKKSQDIEEQNGPNYGTVDVKVGTQQDLLDLQDLDPAFNQKMRLVNDAIDEIGWTPYHLKLFFLNGFGYAVDSMILLFQSIIATQSFREFGEKGYANGMTIAAYVGMLTGALFWGFGADIIGRKYAFNITLFLCSVSCIIAGGMPNWPSLGLFIALVSFGAGGNLVMDTAVFLEYLPSNKQWLLTLMACWWGFGQAIAGFIAWGFMVPERWNCVDVEACTRGNNMGWRYVMFTGGTLVFCLSLLRVTVIRLRETPKYLLGVGKDEEVIETFQYLATKYNRTCSLTLQDLVACGTITSAHSKNRFSISETMIHIRGLFITKKITISTASIFLSWTLIGLAYPLFYVFLPSYLASRGAVFNRSQFEIWRNYSLTNISGIPGPVVAGFMCNTKLGRKYTMVIGALISMAFFFAYTSVKTSVQDLTFTCLIAFCINIYYGTLYAYTPEVLPSAHRATGSAIAVACNRVMGIVSAVVATEANTDTPAPLNATSCFKLDHESTGIGCYAAYTASSLLSKAQALAHWHRILLSLIIPYPTDGPLSTSTTHFQPHQTSRYQVLKAETSAHISKSTLPSNSVNPLKQPIMSSVMSEKPATRSKRNSPKRSLASSSATSDAKRRKSEHVKKFTEMKLDDVEQIFQKSRDALNKAEELYQDAEKARTEKLETYMDAARAMTGAHQTLSSAMVRKANATKDVARLEMIKDAREAIGKRDNLQIQVDKQKKELFAVETKLLMWDNIANMAVENLKEDDLEHLFQFQE